MFIWALFKVGENCKIKGEGHTAIFHQCCFNFDWLSHHWFIIIFQFWIPVGLILLPFKCCPSIFKIKCLMLYLKYLDDTSLQLQKQQPSTMCAHPSFACPVTCILTGGTWTLTWASWCKTPRRTTSRWPRSSTSCTVRWAPPSSCVRSVLKTTRTSR